MEEMDFDYVSSCIDEIALEGLDGITIRSLWKRLLKRPKFPIAIDADSKSFLWECVALHQDIEMFELPEPRVPLIIINRYAKMDMDFGIVLESEEEIQEPYPYALVDDNKKVRGSCSTYKTRINVTSLVRENGILLMEFDDALIKWSEKLIFVASQHKRHVALFGTNVAPNLTLNPITYCILERIGRSRFHGEVTQGKYSLADLNISPKTMFYYRKKLLAKKLIVKQSHYQKTKDSPIIRGSLFQLTRFYVERRSKIEVMIMTMCKILETKPNKQEAFLKLRAEMGMKEGSFKKMFGKVLKDCIKLKVIPYTEMYPDSEKSVSHSLNGKEKVVKVVQLLKTFEEQELEEEECDAEEDEKPAEDNEIMFHPSKLYFNLPILEQSYKVIDDAGPEGISGHEIGRKMGLPKLEVRCLCRGLEKRDAIMVVMQDQGRQRSMKFISKRFEGESEAHQQVVQMQQKLMQYSENTIQENAAAALPFEEMEIVEMGIDVAECTIREGDMPNVTVQQVTDEEPDKPSKSWSFSLKDINRAFSKKENVPSFTFRMLKRANRIIELVREAKIFDQLHKLRKMLIEEEEKEGIVEQLDRASTSRIIHRLSKDGYIKSIKTILQSENRTRKLHFICDANVSHDDPVVQRAIEEAKLRYFCTPVASQKKEAQPKSSPKEESIEEEPPAAAAASMLPKYSRSSIKLEYIPNLGRVYGFQPKYARMKSFHLLLVYLIYDYGGDPKAQPESGSGCSSSEPTVHLDCEDWRRFLPPLPNREHGKGWCLFSDIILCMPLSLLLRIVNFTHEIPGLLEFIKDDLKKHYLLQHLPLELKNHLLSNRKYVFSMHEILTKVSFIGLISFGPQMQKEKEKCCFYVHKQATMKDTTTSSPGYIYVSQKEYPIISYRVESAKEAEFFWDDLERVCLHTPLGSFNTAKGQSITVMMLAHKPEMIEACRCKSVEEIKDDGTIPGDSLGAAGHDSALFSHLKRNWNWPSCPKICKDWGRKDKTKIEMKVGSNYLTYLTESDVLATNNHQNVVASRKRLGRLPNVKPVPTMQTVAEETALDKKGATLLSTKTKKRKREVNVKDTAAGSLKKQRRNPIIRVKVINRKQSKTRRPYYDEKDKIAINKMTKQRVDWSVQEDSFLLLCKVASCFLDRNYRGMVVPYSVVRDLLHDNFPDLSFNKTSRACQRRVSYMLRNPTTVFNVSVYLGESNQDPELVKQFQGPKPPKTNDLEWSSMFTEVVRHLIEKYTLEVAGNEPKVYLPTSMPEFLTKFQVSVSGNLKDKRSMHVDPKNDFDIHCSVVFSLVLQGLSSLGDKNSWSFTLYKMYQQYPDTLLRAVIMRLKHDGVISKRKDLGKRMEMAVPLSSFPHRLSKRYDNILLSRYQEELYPQVNSQFRKLVDGHLALNRCELSVNIQPGETATIVSLIASRNIDFEIDIPDQIIAFDEIPKDFKKKIEAKAKEMMTPSSSLDTPLRSLSAGGGESAKDTTLKDVSSSKRTSRYALYLMRHHLNEISDPQQPRSADNFLINSCNLYAKLIPFEKNLKPLKKKVTAKDYSPLEVKRIKEIIETQKMFYPKEFPSINQSDVSLTYCLQGFSDQAANIGFAIYTRIFEANELGCTYDELWYEFNEKCSSEANLSVQLFLLQESECILRAGVTCYRFIALCHSRPWLLTSIKIPKEKRILASQMTLGECSNPVRVDTSQHSEALEALKAGIQKKNAFSSKKEKETARLGVDSSSLTSSKRKTVSEPEVKQWFELSVLNKLACLSEPEQNMTEEKIRNWFSKNVLDPVETICLDFDVEKCIQDCLLKELERREEMQKENVQRETLIEIDQVEKCSRESLQLEEISETDEEKRATISDLLTQIGEFAEKQFEKVVEKRESVLLPGSSSNEESDKPSTKIVQSIPEISRDISRAEESGGVASTSKSSNLKRRLKEKVALEVQALHQKVKQKFDNPSSVSVISQWLQKSILKKLEDQCSVEDIKVWFKKSILEKVGNPDAIGDLKQWFEESIISEFEDGVVDPSPPTTKRLRKEEKVENIEKRLEESLLSKIEEQPKIDRNNKIFVEWFDENVLSKIENQIIQEETKEWFEAKVLKRIEEDSLIENVKKWFEVEILNKLEDSSETDLKLWFEDSFMKRVRKACSEDCLKEWFREIVLLKVEKERFLLDEIGSWFKENVMSKVENVSNSKELEEWMEKTVLANVSRNLADDQELVKWFIENVLKKVEIIAGSNDDHLKSWIRENVLDKVEDKLIENDVDDWLKMDVLEKLEMRPQDLEIWFNKVVLSKIEKPEIVDDLSVWFRENLIKVIEETRLVSKNILEKETTFNFEELKKWLDVEVLSKIEEDNVEEIKDFLKNTIIPSTILKLDIENLSEHLISKVEEMETSEEMSFSVSRWCQENLLSKIEEFETKNDIRLWLEEKLNALLSPECSRQEEEELVHLSVRNCLKAILCAIETDSRISEEKLSSRSKEDLKSWFERSILAILPLNITAMGTSQFSNPVQETENIIVGYTVREIVENVDFTLTKDDSKAIIHEIVDNVISTDASRMNTSEMITEMVEDIDSKIETNTVISEIIENVVSVQELKRQTGQVLETVLVNVTAVEELENETSTIIEEIIENVSSKNEAAIEDEKTKFEATRTIEQILVNVDSEELSNIDSIQIESALVDDIEINQLIEENVSLIALPVKTSPAPKVVPESGRRSRRKTNSTPEAKLISISEDFVQVRYVSRIWKKPDGSINRPALQKLLTAVLGHIMTFPGINEVKMVQKFELCLSPTQVLDLIEILVKIECVEPLHVQLSKRFNVFDSKVSYKVVEQRQPSAQTYYEAKVDALIKLAQFANELIIQHA